MATIENGTTTTYTYGASGMLTEEVDNSLERSYIGNNSGILMQINSEGKVYDQVINRRGDVNYLVTKGKIANQYEYSPYGELLSSTESITNHMKYSGEQQDSFTGNYYPNTRFYSPELGRFTQEDSYLGDGNNLYAYVQNNPMNYVDPSGMSSVKTCDKADSGAYVTNTNGNWYEMAVAAAKKIENVIYSTLLTGTGIDYYKLSYEDKTYVRYAISTGIEDNLLCGAISKVARLDRYKGDNYYYWKTKVYVDKVFIASYTIITAQQVKKACAEGTIGVPLVFSGVGAEVGLVLTRDAAVSMVLAGVGTGATAHSEIILQADYKKLNSTPKPGAGGGSGKRGIGGKGWRGDKDWRNAVKQVESGGTIRDIKGQVPTQQEAIDLIKESGGKVLRIEGPHEAPNPHNFPHINYTTPRGGKGTIEILS